MECKRKCSSGLKYPKVLAIKLRNILTAAGKSERCVQCNLSVVNLTNHKNNIHKNSLNIFCQLCTSKFTNFKDLVKHERVIHGHLKSCPLCEKRIEINNSKQHFEKHSIPTYQCELCTALFFSSSNLTLHMKNHIRKLLCHNCGNFYNSDKLQYHKCHVDFHMKRLKKEDTDKSYLKLIKNKIIDAEKKNVPQNNIEIVKIGDKLVAFITNEKSSTVDVDYYDKKIDSEWKLYCEES